MTFLISQPGQPERELLCRAVLGCAGLCCEGDLFLFCQSHLCFVSELEG